ncbi:MAG TPA: peptidoglycan-binding domain-containing protein [Rhizomicrobium sp.]|nr:peptidoglycan-binding domain-containing protein [Rhizomicrobium sp.]
MTATRHAAALTGLLLLGLSAASCSQQVKPQPRTAAAHVAPAVAVAEKPASLSTPSQELVSDERTILAAQRALAVLGYNGGKADGVLGPATRRAIQAFQKDHGLAEDGRLTFALADMLNSVVAQLAKSQSITVAAGDSIIFADGGVDSATHERSVQWDQDRGIVAVRPSTADWPPPARAGLDWAITHALDDGGTAPIQWSSTGVDQHFEIHVFAALSPHEAAVAGNGQSCRHFELRADERRYPGLACKDAKANWVLPHTSIRLARPAAALGAAGGSGASGK